VKLIFWTPFAAWSVSELALLWRRRSTPRGLSAIDRFSLPVVVLAGWLGIALDLAAARFLPQAAFGGAVFLPGLLLMLAGMALRWHAIALLGRDFTVDVATRPGQRLVEAGAYRYIRHPAYAGLLLIFLGIGLALGNWARLAANLALSGAGFAYRITVEEAALIAAFGEPYIGYRRRTKRLIPFVF
jgi:protein-S-isoprenylcysteine O-methyltransferase Ste14